MIRRARRRSIDRRVFKRTATRTAVINVYSSSWRGGTRL